jgi:hypothetical protein
MFRILIHLHFQLLRIRIRQFVPRIRILPVHAKTVKYILPFIQSENIGDYITESYKMI